MKIFFMYLLQDRSLTHPQIIKIINVQVHLWELIAVHFLQVLIILYTCTYTRSVRGLDLSHWITDWSYKRLHGLRPELCVTCTLITVNHFELQMYLLNLLCWQSHSLPSWFNYIYIKCLAHHQVIMNSTNIFRIFTIKVYLE